MRRLIALLFVFFHQQSFCGIGADLEGFFHKLGSTTNVTGGGAHTDQSGGYYTGGGVTMRNRAKNSQVGTLQLPSLRAGCGGIDMFTGGLSFLSGAELVNTLKSIGANAASYGFMLAMKTFAPSVQSVMAELQDLANKINQSNINSCETASALLGGVLPKSDLTSRHICQSIGSSDGIFNDWAAARQGCGAEGKTTSVNARRGEKEEYKNLLAEEFNVAWEVIQKNGFLNSDRELAELCMTISGTIVAYKEGESRKVVTYPSRADNDDLIKALFEGGTLPIYACGDGKCLRVQAKDHKISAGGFATRVRSMITAISRKAVNDEELTTSEIAFIGSTRLPLYKMVNVLATYRRHVYTLEEFTDIICIDMIHQYISEILDVMLEETANLKNAQVSDEEINSFIKQIQKAKLSINVKRKMAYEQMNNMLLMIQSAKIFEQKLESSFDVLQKGSDVKGVTQ